MTSIIAIDPGACDHDVMVQSGSGACSHDTHISFSEAFAGTPVVVVSDRSNGAPDIAGN